MDNMLTSHSTEKRERHFRVVFQKFDALLKQHISKPFIRRNDNEGHFGNPSASNGSTLVKTDLAKKRTKRINLGFCLNTTIAFRAAFRTADAVMVGYIQINMPKLAVTVLDDSFPASLGCRASVDFQDEHQNVRDIAVDPTDHLVMLGLVDVGVFESEQLKLGFCFRLSHCYGIGGGK